MADPLPAQDTIHVPALIRAGDSLSWTVAPFQDSDGVSYDASVHTLKFQFAGKKYLELTATASGKNWVVSISTTQSAGLIDGPYWWTAQVSVAGVRVTAAQGQVTVLPDLASKGANYDGRTVAQKALEDAQAALAMFKGTGGRVKSYTIGGRQMQFQTDAEALAVVNYWKKEVAAERMNSAGGRGRMITLRFDRAR